LEDIYDIISDIKSDVLSDLSNICFGLSFNEIVDDYRILNELKISGFDFILIPENYEPSIFIPFIQEAKSLDLQVFVKLGIFLDIVQVKFANKFLNLGIPPGLLAEMEKSDNPLNVSIKFAREYIEFLNVLEVDGLFLILPQNEKNLLIKEQLFSNRE
jgi:hypothetical protein